MSNFVEIIKEFVIDLGLDGLKIRNIFLHKLKSRRNFIAWQIFRHIRILEYHLKKRIFFLFYFIEK